MHTRAVGSGSQPYPYGSEFAFDTMGQEAVVVWLLHFAIGTNTFANDAKRTVDHILSYMRSSPTWAYNGGSRSWGDLGNNGKWQVTTGANYETRGNFHYRSGLNAIPLLEWYRGHPDDVFLLEPALGAVAGQVGAVRTAERLLPSSPPPLRRQHGGARVDFWRAARVQLRAPLARGNDLAATIKIAADGHFNCFCSFVLPHAR